MAFVFPSTSTEYTITSVGIPACSSASGVGSNRPWFVSLFAWDLATNRTVGAAIGTPIRANCGGGCQNAAWLTDTGRYTFTGGTSMVMQSNLSTCLTVPEY